MSTSTAGPADDNQRDSYRLTIRYVSDHGHHDDNLYVQHENIDAVIDTLPGRISKTLSIFRHEASTSHEYSCRTLFNGNDHPRVIAVNKTGFNRRPGNNISIEPRQGRFYPAFLFNSDKLSSVNRMKPVRIVDLSEKEITVDTGHPLSDRNMTLTLERVDAKDYETSDKCRLLDTTKVPDFFTGPGMQLRHGNVSTDFFSDDAMQRADDMIDSTFYSRPRLVNHIDEAAQVQLRSVYSDLVPARSSILDLMSSINSHLDTTLSAKKITGLGMNQEELSANPCLDEIIVHDINQQHTLPFDDDSFDVVTCSLSIEYITHPSALFDEVGRVLRSGGRFIISFSNRWFPTKAIKIWNNLHDFERIGLVMEYFIAASRFTNINTRSLRGIPRPADDRHDTPMSDPLYIVWADRT